MRHRDRTRQTWDTRLIGFTVLATPFAMLAGMGFVFWLARR